MDAVRTIVPRKAIGSLSGLYVRLARLYEEGRVGSVEHSSLEEARKVLESGTKVNFRSVEELAEIWCEWVEMEVRHKSVQSDLCSCAVLIYIQQLYRGI